MDPPGAEISGLEEHVNWPEMGKLSPNFEVEISWLWSMGTLKNLESDYMAVRRWWDREVCLGVWTRLSFID